MELLILIVSGLFGTGGIVTFYKARNDYKSKNRNTELDADERFMTRYDREILTLNEENDDLERYITKLQNLLIEHGIKVPFKDTK